MSWRLAKSLEHLREQVNAAYPQRSKKSDGTVGDAAHASRDSDHNPWVKDGIYGVVTAMDITHDPVRGCDAGEMADALVASRDPRIKYVIYNKRIINSQGSRAWQWRPYSGANAHQKHVHISVQADKIRYDDTSDWKISETWLTEVTDEKLAVIEDRTAEPAPIAASTETTSEKVITTATTETSTGTVEKKSIVEKVIGSDQLPKIIASEGVGKLATKAVTALTAGATGGTAGATTASNPWPWIILAIVCLGLATAVVIFWLWHRSSKEKKAAEINSDKDRADVVFEKVR